MAKPSCTSLKLLPDASVPQLEPGARLHRIVKEIVDQEASARELNRVAAAVVADNFKAVAQVGDFSQPDLHHPIVCSTGNISISQVLSCVKKPNRKASPVSTRSAPIVFST